MLGKLEYEDPEQMSIATRRGRSQDSLEGVGSHASSDGSEVRKAIHEQAKVSQVWFGA